MKAEINIQYKINEHNFELKITPNIPIRLKKLRGFSVTFPHNTIILHKENPDEVTFSIQKNDEVEYWIISNYGKICIRTEKPKDWQRFLDSNFLQMVGLISAASISKGKEDFLWLEPSNNEKVWVLGIVWNNDDKYWEGMLVERTRQVDLDRGFWSIKPEQDKRDREQYAHRLFNSLTDGEALGLPDSFPFCSDSLISNQSKSSRQLTIKVNLSELWFLLFPVDHFYRFQYGRFSLYKEVEWIISNKKSFIQNIYERSLIQSELQNMKNFLKYSVIFLNTYIEFEKNSDIKDRCRKGTNLVTEILFLLQNIEIEGVVLSLRWYLNPTKEEIHSELLNHNTRYFFANFHAEGGNWKSGEGKKAAWKNNPTLLQKFKSDPSKKEALSHIRLMRIFHCHSVLFHDAIHVHPSIVPSLLNAGALRVEGSIMEENYLDYLCSLFHLFRHPQGLEFVLMGKCLEKSIDFNNLMRRVDDFLKYCNK